MIERIDLVSTLFDKSVCEAIEDMRGGLSEDSTKKRKAGIIIENLRKVGEIVTT